MQKLSKITFRNNKNWMNDEDAVRDWIATYRKEKKSKSKNKPATKIYNSLSEEQLDDLYERYNLYRRKNRNTDTSAHYIDEAADVKAISQAARKRLLKSDRDEALKQALDAIDRSLSVTQDIKLQELRDKIYSYSHNPNRSKDSITRRDVGSVNDATPKQIERWKRIARQSDALQALKGGALGSAIGCLYFAPISTSIGLGTAAYYKSKADKAEALSRLNEVLPELTMVSNNQNL